VKHSYRTRPICRLACLGAFWAAVLLTFNLLGCSAAVDRQLPTVELSASALAPVGGTIPVFVRRRCTANCGFKSSPLTRQQVAARNESGQYVQAISVDDAVKLAGGTEALLDALNARESHASTVARESLFEFQNFASGIFQILTVPLVLLGGASLATQPSETIEKIRLNQITIPDCPYPLEVGHGCPIGSEASHLHHDPAMPGAGWVFFPMGKYTQMKASYDWFPFVFTGEEERTEIITAPWNVSSSPPGTLPCSRRPSVVGQFGSIPEAVIVVWNW